MTTDKRKRLDHKHHQQVERTTGFADRLFDAACEKGMIDDHRVRSCIMAAWIAALWACGIQDFDRLGHAVYLREHDSRGLVTLKYSPSDLGLTGVLECTGHAEAAETLTLLHLANVATLSWDALVLRMASLDPRAFGLLRKTYFDVCRASA